MDIGETEYEILKFLKDHKTDINITDEALGAAVPNAGYETFLSAKSQLLLLGFIDKKSANNQWRITPAGETELLKSRVGEMIANRLNPLFDRATFIGLGGLIILAIQCGLMWKSNEIQCQANKITERQYLLDSISKAQSAVESKGKTYLVLPAHKKDTIPSCCKPSHSKTRKHSKSHWLVIF